MLCGVDVDADLQLLVETVFSALFHLSLAIEYTISGTAKPIPVSILLMVIVMRIKHQERHFQSRHLLAKMKILIYLT